jgi:glycosyltransferase involved in cell wall biosynthesis
VCSSDLREDDFLLGTVSRIYPEKNIEMQIKLLHSLIEEIPNVKLVIVGKKYNHAKYLEALAKGLNVQERVFFLGLRRDVPELLRTFDIFLMTSFSEGTSLAILEAMAAGLPVIASDVGGNKNLIDHGESGFLFKVDDFNQLQKISLELYKNTDKRKKVGLHAEQKALSFEKKKMVDEYLSLYSSLFKKYLLI